MKGNVPHKGPFGGGGVALGKLRDQTNAAEQLISNVHCFNYEILMKNIL